MKDDATPPKTCPNCNWAVQPTNYPGEYWCGGPRALRANLATDTSTCWTPKSTAVPEWCPGFLLKIERPQVHIDPAYSTGVRVLQNQASMIEASRWEIQDRLVRFMTRMAMRGLSFPTNKDPVVDCLPLHNKQGYAS